MRQFAKLFLEGKIGRRAFITRLVETGLASATATKLAGSLSAAPLPSEAASRGRMVDGLTGGELMAELLVDWKTPYVFGLGGSEEVGFLDALVDRLSLQFVTGLHESSVVSMADGYARASGETPIVNLHSVAGAGFALGPMVNAFKDRVPMVVTVGTQSTAARGTNAFLEATNLHQLPREYTQWTWDVLSAETIPEVLRRAFVLARVPPGGPTFLTFSKDLWERRVERAEILPRAQSALDVEVAPSPEHVSKIADALSEAQFPVLCAGKELARFGGAEEVMEVAEILGAPVFQDVYASHTPVVFPTTHPLYAGMFTEDASFPPAFDVFWCLGGTMFSLFAESPKPLVPRTARVIHSGLDATEIGRSYPIDLAAVANVKTTAAAVAAELRKRKLDTARIEDRRRVVERYHLDRGARLTKAAERAWSKKPISNERLAVELNRRLDPDAVVVSELITSELFMPAYLDVDHRHRERRVNLATCGGVLGWGVPAALGAKLAQPNRQVVALVGDGSFQFGVHALWSAARYEIPVGIVIWNNGQYQANRRYLHDYGGRAAATGKYIGCNLGSPDVDQVAIAKGYGVEGERVDNPDALGDAFDRFLKALAGGRPYVLDVAVERRFGGADSTWFDFFSVARKTPRAS